MSLHNESDFRLLPTFIQLKRAILNPMNTDNCSFGHAIVLFFHPNEWNIRKSQITLTSRLKDKFAQLGLDKIHYPVQIQDIPSIEDQLNIRINVFSFADTAGYKRHSLYISKNYKPEEVNLLYWEGRFAWIKFLSRLFHDIIKYVILIKNLMKYIVL